MNSQFDNLLLYEEYEKELKIFDSEDSLNKYLESFNNFIEVSNEYKNDKQIVIYNNDDNEKIYEIYTIYVIFIATVYQLILGKDTINKYFA